MKSIKEIISNAGRWEDVMNILNKYLVNPDHLTVQTTIIGKETEWVSFRRIREGIKRWLELIELVETSDPKEPITEGDILIMEAFTLVIESDLEVCLHNYANKCSHGNVPEFSKLEEIRVYQIIDSSLSFINLIKGNYPESEFELPEGWCKC